MAAAVDRPRAARRPGLRGSVAASLALHAVLVTLLFAGAPVPSRRAPKSEKVYVVSLASLPRSGGAAVASTEPKGRPPRPTTQRVKKPPPDDTKPKVDLDKPKRKKKEEEKPAPPAPIKSNEPATKANEIAPVGTPAGTERAGQSGLGLPSGGSGIGLSGAGTDTDFPFTYYLVAVRNKIANQWSPPKGVSAGGAALRATLYFRILRGGTVTEIAVEQSSGVGFYDQSAMRAVQAAMPLPPLPEEFPDEYLGVHFDFQFVE